MYRRRDVWLFSLSNMTVVNFLQHLLKTDIDDCASHPCTNNGTCTDRVNGFNCSCTPGFNGTQCETGNRCHSKSKRDRPNVGMRALTIFHSFARPSSWRLKRALRKLILVSGLHSLTWCQKWWSEKIQAPPGEDFKHWNISYFKC